MFIDFSTMNIGKIETDINYFHDRDRLYDENAMKVLKESITNGYCFLYRNRLRPSRANCNYSFVKNRLDVIHLADVTLGL